MGTREEFSAYKYSINACGINVWSTALAPLLMLWENTLHKSNLGKGNGSFSLQFQATDHYLVNVTEAGACDSWSHSAHSQSRAKVTAPMLSTGLLIICSASFPPKQFRTTCLGNGASHNQLDSHIPINNQDSLQETCPQTKLISPSFKAKSRW